MRRSLLRNLDEDPLFAHPRDSTSSEEVELIRGSDTFGRQANSKSGHYTAICSLVVILALITLTVFGVGAIAVLAYDEVGKLRSQNQNLSQALSKLEAKLDSFLSPTSDITRAQILGLLENSKVEVLKQLNLTRNQLLMAINHARTEVLLTQGTVYTRWGNAACPVNISTATLYSGVMVGSNSSDSDSSSTRLCLPPDPYANSSSNNTNSSNHQAFTNISPIIGFNNSIVPCAICSVSGRSRSVMIPAKTVCPDEWTREYCGYIMAGSFLCVDQSVGTEQQRGDGVGCEELPCPLFEEQGPPCVVCTY